MPIYEYECSNCGEKFELFERIYDANHKAKCPKCRDSKLRRVLSTFVNNISSGQSCGPTRPT